MCDRVAVMYAGQLVEVANTDALFREPRHPYTVGLLSCVPDAHAPRGAQLAPIPGVVPDPGDLPPGCRFAPRCPLVIEQCTSGPIAVQHVGADHFTRCIRPQDVSRTAGLFEVGAA
jgi:oligopeptide/dipeptide ABC transporter ATP-binding protein